MNVYKTSAMMILLFLTSLFIYTVAHNTQPDIGISVTVPKPKTDVKIKNNKIWTCKIVYSKVQEYFNDIKFAFNNVIISTTKNVLFIDFSNWTLLTMGISIYPQYELSRINSELVVSGSTNFSLINITKDYIVEYKNIKDNISGDVTAIVSNELNEMNTVYLGTSNGALYLYNIVTNDLKLVAKMSISIMYLNFNLNNQLFACNGVQLFELTDDNKFVARYSSSNLKSFIFIDKYCVIGGEKLSILPSVFNYSTSPIHTFNDITNVNGMTIMSNLLYVTTNKNKTGYIYEIPLY